MHLMRDCDFTMHKYDIQSNKGTINLTTTKKAEKLKSVRNGYKNPVWR